MVIYTLRKKIREYQRILNRKNNSIGSILKHHRKEQNLTLEDASEGICSISYLCKVEQNQLMPSDKILPNLINRLQIKEMNIFNEDTATWINEIINNEKVPEKLYLENKNNKDYKSKLIVYAYQILNKKDFSNIEKKHLSLTSYFSHFLEDEMCLFMYLTINVFFEQERYLDILSLSKEIDTFNKTNKVLIQTKYLKLKAIYKLGKDNLIKKIQQTLVDYLVDYNELEKLSEIRNYYLAFEAKTLNTKELTDKLNQIKKIDDVNKNYIMFSHHYYQTNNLNKAYNYIKEISHLKGYYYTMYLIVLYQLKKEEELKIALKTPFDNLKPSYEVIKTYLGCSLEEKTEYIKNTIVRVSVLIEEKIILDFLYNEAYRHLKNKFLYRDAVIVLEKYNNTLRERRKCFI